MLLNAHISEMDVHVVEFGDTCVVLHGAETTESKFKQIGLQRAEGSNQNVESQIELLATDQQRVVNIPGDHVTFFPYLWMERSFRFTRPAFQLRKLVDEEDSSSLTFPAGFHDPRTLRIFPVLFDEHVVIWKNIKKLWTLLDKSYLQEVQM